MSVLLTFYATPGATDLNVVSVLYDSQVSSSVTYEYQRIN